MSCPNREEYGPEDWEEDEEVLKDQPERWNRIKLFVSEDDVKKGYQRALDSMARLNHTEGLMNNAEDDKLFRCDLCSTVAACKSRMVEHLESIHQTRKFKCEQTRP